jgi:hypothetical protein
MVIGFPSTIAVPTAFLSAHSATSGLPLQKAWAVTEGCLSAHYKVKVKLDIFFSRLGKAGNDCSAGKRHLPDVAGSNHPTKNAV